MACVVANAAEDRAGSYDLVAKRRAGRGLNAELKYQGSRHQVVRERANRGRFKATAFSSGFISRELNGKHLITFSLAYLLFVFS